jgi:hypothetical protein
MTKGKLNIKVAEIKKETKNALEIMYNALNQGQQKKILKDEKVKELFIRYGIEV